MKNCCKVRFTGDLEGSNRFLTRYLSKGSSTSSINCRRLSFSLAFFVGTFVEERGAVDKFRLMPYFDGAEESNQPLTDFYAGCRLSVTNRGQGPPQKTEMESGITGGR